MERNVFIRRLEEAIPEFQRQMHQATRNHDKKALVRLSEGFRQAQYEWLMAARGMSSEKARAVMIGFAVGRLTKWMEGEEPGPPPSVLTLHDRPISDREFGRLMKQNTHRADRMHDKPDSSQANE
jgi:hypothetical protein